MLLSPGRVPITMTTHDNTLPRDSVSTGTNCSPSRNSFRICDCSRCSSPSSASCQWIPDPKCISTIFRFFSLLKSLQLFFWIAKGIKMVKPFFQYVLNYTVICEILHCIGETAFGVLNGDASSWNTMKYCQNMSRFCLIFSLWQHNLLVSSDWVTLLFEAISVFEVELAWQKNMSSLRPNWVCLYQYAAQHAHSTTWTVK